MALVNHATQSAALTQRFADRLSSTINRAVLAAQLVPVENSRGQGQNIQWDAKFDGGVAAPAAEGADTTVYNNDDKVPAVLQFSQYKDAFKITGFASALARAAGNPAALSDTFMDQLGDSIERMAKGISVGLYTGDGTGSPQKINGMVPSTGVAAIDDTGIYAGIDRASRTAWRSSVVDATAFDVGNNPTGRFGLTVAGEAPEGVQMMREITRLIYEASSEQYDVIVTSPLLHQAYGLATHTDRRWTDTIRTAAGMVKLDQGYQWLEWDGIPIIQDVDCPDDEMLFLNTRHMKIQQVPDGVNRMHGPSSMGTTALAGTPDQYRGSGKTKLQARIQREAILGDAFPFALYAYLNLCVKSPNRFGRITGLIP